LSKTITSGGDEIPVITLAPDLEQMLHQSLQAGGEDGAGIEPGLAEKIQQSLTEASQQQELAGRTVSVINVGHATPCVIKILKTRCCRFTCVVLSRDTRRQNK